MWLRPKHLKQENAYRARRDQRRPLARLPLSLVRNLRLSGRKWSGSVAPTIHPALVRSGCSERYRILGHSSAFSFGPGSAPTFEASRGIPMTANGKTVLLVEDNEDNRIVYSTILRHFGYSVSEALNGEEGISKARVEKPDLILMDISIPVIDGWEATQVLKHDPQTREIPIIALTAHALASDREKAMEVGCDGYLAKPCEPRAVVAEVQRFLGKNNGA